MGFTCILYTNIILDCRYWDFNSNFQKLKLVPFFHSLPNDKVLEWSKFKAFADWQKKKINN